MGKPDYRLTHFEASAIEERFRLMTHRVANWVTVVKALAEMAERNPSAYENLIATKLMQCPELVHEIRAFADDMYQRINPLVPMPAVQEYSIFSKERPARTSAA